MPKVKIGKKTKRPDRRPARKGYWDALSLAKRKIKNLMSSNCMTFKEAKKMWVNARTKRIPEEYILKVKLNLTKI